MRLPHWAFIVVLHAQITDQARDVPWWFLAVPLVFVIADTRERRPRIEDYADDVLASELENRRLKRAGRTP